MGSKIQGKNARRNPETGAMQKMSFNSKKGEKRYILLSCRSVGNASTLFDRSRRARNRNRPRVSMQMLSKKDLSSDEMETLWRSRNPTTAVTARRVVQKNEEAQVCEHDLHLFVIVPLLEDAPAVLSLGKLCEEHGYIHEWAGGQKPHLTKDGKNISGRLRTTFLWWSLDYHGIPARAPPRHRLRRFIHEIKQPREVTRKTRETVARELLETAVRVFPSD